MIVAVLLVLAVALVLFVAALVQRDARRRIAVREQYRARPVALLDPWAGLVTWQQVAALLPADLVDRIEHPDGYRLDSSGGRTVVETTDAGGRPIVRHLR